MGIEEFKMAIEAFRLDLGLKILIAILTGGGIGLERELRAKPAGLRTNILICVGSALLMDLSIRVAGPGGDPGRIAAQVVTGIGFLGAGTILHTRGTISGLTSAATIWVVAAIGLTAGAGYYFEALAATATVMLVLRGLGWIEGNYLSRRSDEDQGVIGEDRKPRSDGRRSSDGAGERASGAGRSARGGDIADRDT